MIRVLLFSLLPVALPALLLLIQMTTVGDAWPRDIAPGSGLKLWGFLAVALTTFGAWLLVARKERDTRLLRISALFLVMTGLVSWPLWSAGLLPSVNGMSLGPNRVQSMRVERLEATRQSRRTTYNYWAWLAPHAPNSELQRGRYFISQDIYQRLTASGADGVQINHARGALGAVAITDIR